MNPWLLLGGVASIAIAGVGGAYLGYQFRDGQVAKDRIRTVERVVRVVEKQGAVTTAAATRDQSAQDRVRYITRTITQEIPGAITHETDVRYALPVSLIRLHDQAALGLPALPDAAIGAYDAPSPIVASALARTIVGNYGECHADAERLSALQDWVTGQQTAFNSR